MRYFILFLIITCFSCAPTYSEFQSARTIEKGKVELTPSYSVGNTWRNNRYDYVQQHVGFGVGYGVGDRYDMRFRYEYIRTSKDFSTSGHVLGIEGKYSILKDKISIGTAFGRGLGKDLDDSWQIHPKMLFTYPVIQNKFEISFIPKYILPLNRKNTDVFTTNFGIAYGPNLKKWAIRLDYGILFETDNDFGNVHTYSVGFNYVVN